MGLLLPGAKSNYRVAVGRSRNVAGPYLDREGKDMLVGGGTPSSRETSSSLRLPDMGLPITSTVGRMSSSVMDIALLIRGLHCWCSVPSAGQLTAGRRYSSLT